MTDPATKPDPAGVTDHACALIDKTSDAVGKEVDHARGRVSTAIEGSKRFCRSVNHRVVDSAKATDKAMHRHPYGALAIGVGLGTLLGALVAHRIARCRR